MCFVFVYFVYFCLNEIYNVYCTFLRKIINIKDKKEHQKKIDFHAKNNKKSEKDNHKKINFQERNSKKVEKDNQKKINFHGKNSTKFENRKVRLEFLLLDFIKKPYSFILIIL